jgi:D-3-phosphoglycerate dehydrogenase
MDRGWIMGKTSLDKSKIKFLLLEGIHPSALKVLHDAGYTNVEALTGALDGEELKRKIADVHFVGIRSRTQLTADVFAAAQKLVAVGCFCIGTNQVDLNAARERGVVVFNAPYSNTRSVAELVLGEAILLLRGIPEKNAVSHRGGWKKSAENSFEIRGKTLGIVGYGSIGTQLSVLAEGLGMKVIFHDVVTKLPLGNAQQSSGLNELLAQSDIVTLHVPELASTNGMMGAAQIAAMKPGSILINASRGTVVDIEALAESLKAASCWARPSTSSPRSPRATRTNSCRRCAAWTTSSSRRISAAPPWRRRPISVWKWRKSWSSTATTARPPRPSTSPKWRCPSTPATTASCMCTRTARHSLCHQPGVCRQRHQYRRPVPAHR